MVGARRSQFTSLKQVRCPYQKDKKSNIVRTSANKEKVMVKEKKKKKKKLQKEMRALAY